MVTEQHLRVDVVMLTALTAALPDARVEPTHDERYAVPILEAPCRDVTRCVGCGAWCRGGWCSTCSRLATGSA